MADLNITTFGASILFPLSLDFLFSNDISIIELVVLSTQIFPGLCIDRIGPESETLTVVSTSEMMSTTCDNS